MTLLWLPETKTEVVRFLMSISSIVEWTSGIKLGGKYVLVGENESGEDDPIAFRYIIERRMPNVF